VKQNSINNLFEIEVPDNWNFDYDDEVYNIHNFEVFNGIIQISVLFSKTIQFDIHEIFYTESERFTNLKKGKISSYDSVSTSEKMEDDLIKYIWITGDGGVKIFITVITDYDGGSLEQRGYYSQTLQILNTLKIRPEIVETL
jgi:hypothetical protein